MKKMFIALVGLCWFSVSAHAGSSWLTVVHDGDNRRVTGIDREATTVCALKARVAGMFDLKMSKFDLHVRSGRILSDKVNLVRANVSNGAALQVIEKNHSRQCT